MEEKVTHIPALRFGEPYKSLDTNDLGNVLRSGARLEVSVANAGIIRRDKLAIEKGRAALEAIPAEMLLDAAEKAADIYLDMEEASQLIAATQQEISRAALMEQLNQSFGLITPEMAAVVGGVKEILFGEAGGQTPIADPPYAIGQSEFVSPLEM